MISTLEGVCDSRGDLAFVSAISFAGELAFGFAGGFVGDLAVVLGGGFAGEFAFGFAGSFVGDFAFVLVGGFAGDCTFGFTGGFVGDFAFVLGGGFAGDFTFRFVGDLAGDLAFDFGGCFLEGDFGLGFAFFGAGLDFFFGEVFDRMVLFQTAPQVLAILHIFLSAWICLASKNW